MIVDLDTRKLEPKENDLLLYNGEKWVLITKEELLKPLQKQIDDLKKVEKELYKANKFNAKLKGIFKGVKK